MAAKTGVFSTQCRIKSKIAARQARAIASLSLHDQLVLDFAFETRVFLPDFSSMPGILPPDTGQCRELFVIRLCDADHSAQSAQKGKLGHYRK
jgi:hypothetical protein